MSNNTTVIVRVPVWANAFVRGVLSTTKNAHVKEKTDGDGDYWAENFYTIMTSQLAFVVAVLSRLGVPQTCSISADKNRQMISEWMESVYKISEPGFKTHNSPLQANGRTDKWTNYIESDNGSSWFGFRSTVKMDVAMYAGWDDQNAVYSIGKVFGYLGDGLAVANSQWSGPRLFKEIAKELESGSEFLKIKDGVGSNLAQWIMAHCYLVDSQFLVRLLDDMKTAGVDFNTCNKLGNNISHSVGFNGLSESTLDGVFDWCIKNEIDWKRKNLKGFNAMDMVERNANRTENFAGMKDLMWPTPIYEWVAKWESIALRNDFPIGTIVKERAL